MNDYDDYDPHEPKADGEMPRLDDSLADELLGQVSPDTSLQSGTRIRRRSAQSPTFARSDLHGGAGAGSSLADELGGHIGAPSLMPGSSSLLSLDGASDGAGAAPGESLGDELAGLEMTSTKSAPIVEDGSEESRAAQEQARYEETAAALAESVRTTEEFLSRLRQATATETRTASSSTTDDATSFEAIGNALSFTLREHTKQREAQVRELQEMIRSVSRDDFAYRVALAQALSGAATQHVLSDTSEDDEERARAQRLSRPLEIEDLNAPFADVLGYSSGSKGQTTTSDGSRSRNDAPQGHYRSAQSSGNSATLNQIREEEPEMAITQSPLSPLQRSSFSPQLEGRNFPDSRYAPGPAQILAGPSHRAPVAAHLEHLQAVTVSLISSLQAMNEHSQMTAAGSREASKRLRVFSKAVAEWQRDNEIAEKSRRRIQQESEQRLGGQATQASQWVKEEVRRIAEELDRAQVRAETLLTPVPLTA
ncbi:unnamed protein product [Parajaminaea phylloscopi]